MARRRADRDLAGVTVDEKRGLVYLPTGNPGNLYYGGARPGDNLFAETLIALDAETGKRKWHYQLVHHGVWDYSLPTQAMLMELTVNGQKIDAVTQLTKHGFVFAFDRVTGQAGLADRGTAVPQSDVPGERTARRSRFPTRPPPVNPQGVTLEDAFDLTPEMQAAARLEMQKYRIGPVFTPPSLEGLAGPAWSGRRGELGRRFVRSRDRHALRQDVQQLRMLRLQKYDPATTRIRSPASMTTTGWATSSWAAARPSWTASRSTSRRTRFWWRST